MSWKLFWATLNYFDQVSLDYRDEAPSMTASSIEACVWITEPPTSRGCVGCLVIALKVFFSEFSVFCSSAKKSKFYYQYQSQPIKEYVQVLLKKKNSTNSI